ncbi:MAG: ABC transporter ATP-binding protein, partial [Chloroflexi bacterium]|nr:ABC transporter ATP-binding protein [Chloroflexota bacterium]
LAIVGLLVVASTLLTLVGPLLLGKAVDVLAAVARPGDKLDGEQLLRYVLLMSAAYLGAWAVQVGEGVAMASVGQRALRQLRQELFDHLQSLSLSFFDRRPSGELMSRLTNDIDTINRFLTQSGAQMLTSLLTLGAILVTMFLLNIWLTLGSLLVLPLMVLLTVAVGKRTRGGFRDLQARLGQLNGMMEETLSGQRVVLAFGRQEATIQRFEAANIAARDAAIQAQTFAFLIPPLMGILADLDIAVVAGLGGALALRGLVTVGIIATFISYARRFAQPLRQLADLYNSIQSALAGAERIFEILDERPEIADAPDAIELPRIVGEVEFDKVHFAYVPGVPVLRDVSLHARPGQTIALVGPTGAGKTTIVNLLGRFYDLQAGTIRVDGHDIRSVRKNDLRRQLGIVLQDTFLFGVSVLENIRYGRLDASDQECIAAAKLANAHGFITRLPDGYYTILSERGSNLSQGQRQLLAIARAVVADPRILILDEATSSVDTRTEAHIQEALLRLMEGRTSFVIAHRLSTIRNADVVLVIHEGQIIERGTHEELLARQGFYYNLYMSQFRRGEAVSVT